MIDNEEFSEKVIRNKSLFHKIQLLDIKMNILKEKRVIMQLKIFYGIIGYCKKLVVIIIIFFLGDTYQFLCIVILVAIHLLNLILTIIIKPY